MASYLFLVIFCGNFLYTNQEGHFAFTLESVLVFTGTLLSVEASTGHFRRMVC